jgi:hypothetical protein
MIFHVSSFASHRFSVLTLFHALAAVHSSLLFPLPPLHGIVSRIERKVCIVG